VVWSNWSELVMTQAAVTLTAPTAPPEGMRFYRALVLDPGPGSGHAPAALTPAESFRLTRQSAGIEYEETLMVLTDTAGLLIQSGPPPENGMTLVNLRYVQDGFLSATLEVVTPPGLGFPTSKTNSYLLVFTSSAAGFFERSSSDGAPMEDFGWFERDLSMVGVTLAPAGLQAGEFYRLQITNDWSSNSITLPAHSSTSGAMIESGGATPGQSMSDVAMQYRPLGPLAGLLEVSWEMDAEHPMPGTNSCILLFTSTNTGGFEWNDNMGTGSLGTFERDPSLVGQVLAVPELQAGESYWFELESAGITNREWIMASSPVAGLYVREGESWNRSVSEVELHYVQTSPFSARLEMVFPTNSAYLTPRTNFYWLVYSQTNHGMCRSTDSMAMSGLGSFERIDTPDQTATSPQLRAGEIYAFEVDAGGMKNRSRIVVNSATDGFLVQEGDPSGCISPATFRYTQLGPFGARVEMVLPTNAMYWLPRTNTFLLAYSQADRGTFQSEDWMAIRQVGLFVRQDSLVGQAATEPQLLAGETYWFVYQNAGVTNREWLVVNSPTNGFHVREGDSWSGSMTDAQFRYQSLGPVGARLLVVFPSNSMYLEPRTNTYLLVYTQASRGTYQSEDSMAMQHVGSFERNAEMAGQVAAPLQLRAGDSYWFELENAGNTNREWIVANSPVAGFYVQEGDSWSRSVSEAELRYVQTGPFSAQIEVVLPTNTTYFTPRTNFYWLVYSQTNQGICQNTDSMALSRLGPFERNDGPAGPGATLPQLRAGESYWFEVDAGGITNRSWIMVGSPTNGFLVREGEAEQTISWVGLRYAQRGPFGAWLEVVVPTNSMNVWAQTNTYLLAYSQTDQGTFQCNEGTPMRQAGSFGREDALVGQVAAAPQWQAGETYWFVCEEAGITNREWLLVNSPTTGYHVREGDEWSASITDAELHYEALGTVGARLVEVLSTNSIYLEPRTNTYLLVYAQTNQGTFQSEGSLAVQRFGSFERTGQMVGQVEAPPQFAPGETYHVLLEAAGITNRQTLVVNSATNGFVVAKSASSAGGLTEAVLAYTRLGAFAARVVLVYPADAVFPEPRTNTCLLVYCQTNHGAIEGVEAGTRWAGRFERDTSLAGLSAAPAQLQPGELYEFSFTNTGICSVDLLLVNSVTNGCLVQESPEPDHGLWTATVRYSCLGPLSGRLQLELAPGGMTLETRTNSYLMLFDSAQAGVCQRERSSPTGRSLGRFTKTGP
jgi:hypothetical protein